MGTKTWGRSRFPYVSRVKADVRRNADQMRSGLKKADVRRNADQMRSYAVFED